MDASFLTLCAQTNPCQTGVAIGYNALRCILPCVFFHTGALLCFRQRRETALGFGGEDGRKLPVALYAGTVEQPRAVKPHALLICV